MVSCAAAVDTWGLRSQTKKEEEVVGSLRRWWVPVVHADGARREMWNRVGGEGRQRQWRSKKLVAGTFSNS